MAPQEPLRKLRVLLTEGSSTSAREVLTLLGFAGHHVEVCDPDPNCLCRFSRFTRRLHRCPQLGHDPRSFVAFVLDLVEHTSFDVLIPIHEQGFALATAREALSAHVAVALPDAATYERALDKGLFHAVAAELDVPQPATDLVRDAGGLIAYGKFPLVVKEAIGTASRSVWIATDQGELEHVAGRLVLKQGFDVPVLAQEYVAGDTCHAQSVFDHGVLVAAHGYRQLAPGAGGGPARKVSDLPEDVLGHVARIGKGLEWHGAMSFDYIREDRTGRPYFIDCNPRLVEPMSGQIAGIDLVDALLRVTLAEDTAPVMAGVAGKRSHLALQVLFGLALGGASRWSLVAACRDMLMKRRDYEGSLEELTPFRGDPRSAVPLVFAALMLLVRPGAARHYVRHGWRRHLLNPHAVKIIQKM